MEEKIMDLKEYLKQLVNKVDEQEDEGGVFALYMSENIEFSYHDNCFADFQEDFVILYDKNSGVNFVAPYNSIICVQYMNHELLKKQMKEMIEDNDDMEKLFRKLIGD